MKLNKLLSLLLVLVICVGALASCGLFGPTPDGDGNTVSIDDAAAYLFNMYKDDEGKSTLVDFDIVGKVLIDGVSFEVTWAVNNDAIKIKPSSKANFWTVDLPEVNETEFTYKLTATIKAEDGTTANKELTRVCPVYNNEGVTGLPEAGVTYKLFFYQAKKEKTYYALNTIVDEKYIATTTNPAEASDYFVEVEGDGFKFYTMIDGAKKYVEAYLVNSGEETNDAGETVIHWSKRIKFSDNATVWTYKADCNAWFTTLNDGSYVLGTYSTYTTFSISDGTFMTPDSTGVSQFPANLIKADTALDNAPVGPVEHDCADANGDYVCDTENCGKVLAPPANSTLTLAEATALGLALKGDYTTAKYFITGTITEVYNTTFGNMYITDGVTESFCIYGTYDATGAKKYGEMTTKPVKGDEITVYGVIGSYGDVAQMKNGWIGATLPEGGDNTDAPALVDSPVAGTAYKFGMVQGNLDNAIYYLAGGMDSFYMATTTDAAAALDVYLEETTGGYYLYCYVNSVKTYINMVVSGTHVNGAYEAAASTVYTYNTESKTIVAVVNDTDYWFGTRNDKTYTTMGPCAVSYAGFYGQFYASSTTEQPGGEVTPPSGDGEVTVPDHTCADENGDYKCDTNGCGEVLLPAADSVLTIPQAIALANAIGLGNYTTDKYYVTATIESIYNTTYGNANVVDADDNKYVFYGMASYDADTETETRYDALNYKPVKGDVVTIYGVVGSYNGNTVSYQVKNGWLAEVTAHEHNYTSVVTDPTCTAEGYTTHTCSVCDDSYIDTELDALGHTTEQGVCDRCGKTIDPNAPEAKEPVVFEFGDADSSKSHTDGSENLAANKEYIVGNTILTLTDAVKAYGASYDAKGNSAIKLGTSKLIGSISFTVDADVTSIIIKVAKYKTYESVIDVNGTSYTLTKNSNDGEYDEIVIDTTSAKDITIATVESNYRCMIDSITYCYD